MLVLLTVGMASLMWSNERRTIITYLDSDSKMDYEGEGFNEYIIVIPDFAGITRIIFPFDFGRKPFLLRDYLYDGH